MKILTFILSICLFNNIYSQNNKEVVPAIVSLHDFHNVRDIAISSDGNFAYATVQSPLAEVSVLVHIRKMNGNWNSPEIMSFSGKYEDMEPFLSVDNLKLYFASNRPLDNTSKPKDFDIWYVERDNINSEWGNPINVGSPVNTSYDEFYPSVASNNNMYFTSDNPNAKGKDDIFCSVWADDLYSKPVSLSDSINTESYEFNAYISADEKFIIFSGYNRKDGFGSGDMYISLKDKNNKWTKAKNLGKNINSRYMDYCPFVDTSTMTLYFTSKRSDFKKVQDFKHIVDVVKEINKPKNGHSKIYKVSLSEEFLR
ncbi:MAG: PD40 domain-containing protein [Flavobacteriaceae bacterium]|nr:PD40 domain-containing protein [Flavobacteriaceae bacterium]